MRSHLYWSTFLVLALLPACGSEKVAEPAGEGKGVPAPTKPSSTTTSSQPAASVSKKAKEIAAPVSANRSNGANTSTKKRSPQTVRTTATARKRPAVTTSSAKVGTRIRPPAKAPLPLFDGRRIALVHTSNMIGEIEPCG